MIGISINRDRLASFLRCFSSGKSIECNAGWSCDDAIMLAGAAFFVALSHGPWQLRAAKAAGRDVPDELDSETKEAVDETLLADVHGAVEFCSQLATQIADGVYDGHYEEVVSVLLDGASRRMHPLSGFRSIPE